MSIAGVSGRTIFQQVIITAGVLFIVNALAASSPQVARVARKNGIRAVA